MSRPSGSLIGALRSLAAQIARGRGGSHDRPFEPKFCRTRGCAHRFGHDGDCTGVAKGVFKTVESKNASGQRPRRARRAGGPRNVSMPAKRHIAPASLVMRSPRAARPAGYVLKSPTSLGGKAQRAYLNTVQPRPYDETHRTSVLERARRRHRAVHAAVAASSIPK